MSFKNYGDMDRSFFGILREKWAEEGTMTEDEVRRMANAMAELDYQCEQLQRVLRDEIVPATVAEDYSGLFKAFISYQVTLWQIREFEYITDLEALIEDVLPRLEEKHRPDDEISKSTHEE